MLVAKCPCIASLDTYCIKKYFLSNFKKDWKFIIFLIFHSNFIFKIKNMVAELILSKGPAFILEVKLDFHFLNKVYDYQEKRKNRAYNFEISSTSTNTFPLPRAFFLANLQLLNSSSSISSLHNNSKLQIPNLSSSISSLPATLNPNFPTIHSCKSSLPSDSSHRSSQLASTVYSLFANCVSLNRNRYIDYVFIL